MRARILRGSLCAALCAVAVISVPVPIRAQEFGLDLVASRGDRAEVRTAFGLGLRVAIRPLPIVGLAVEYTRLRAVSDLDGTTCDEYWPENSNCVAESLDNRLRFRTVGYEVFVPIRLAGFELSVATGIDVSTVSSTELRGKDTGRVLHPIVPDEGLLGSIFGFNGNHVRFGVGFRAFLGLPITARLSYQRRNTDLDACATDTYAPFCTSMHSNELLLGISIGG